MSETRIVECQLIATFLAAPDLIVRDIDDLFICEDAKSIYRGMMNAIDDGATVDAAKIVFYMGEKDKGAYDKVLDFRQYAAHTMKKFFPEDIRWCLKTLREAKVRRELAREVGNPAIDYDAIKDKVNSIERTVTTKEGAKTDQGLRELLADLNIPENQKMYCGFKAIDKATRGWRRGDLVSVMSRTTVGKTWLLLNMTDTLARRGFRISFFSMEGALSGTMERMVQIHEGVGVECLTPYFIETTMIPDSKFAEDYRNVSWHNQIYSVEDMGQITDKENPDVVFVDFLNLVRAKSDGSPYERTTQTVTDMKAMAIDKNVCLIYANQISRAGEDGSIPVKLHHARDSGACEELSDFIVGAWRPGLNSSDFSEKYKLKMELLKCKRGYTTGIEARLYPTGRIIEEV